MQDLSYELQDAIAVTTLHRPEARNVLANDTVALLHAAWQRFATSEEWGTRPYHRIEMTRRKSASDTA